MKEITELTYRACSGFGLFLLLYGCCTDIHLSLGRYRDSMDVSLQLIGDLELEIDKFKPFDLNTSIGIWAGFSWSLNAELDIDIDAVDFRTKKLRLDIDRDGVEEAIRALAAVDKSDSNDYRIMVAWKGDTYTLDEETCYLSWLDGNTIVIVSARCNSDETLRKCQMRVDDPSSLSCQGCNADGACVSCDADESVESCKPEGDSTEPTASEQDGRRQDAADEATVDAGAPDSGERAPEAGIDAGDQVDDTLCEQQLDALIRAATDCGKALRPDVQDLCEDSPGDVNKCYSVYDLAELFGQTVCVMISEPFTCSAIVDAESEGMRCEDMLDTIRTAAVDCGLAVDNDLDTACRASASQVESCFVAYGTAQSEGEDVCTILGEATTCSIFN
jgi:hypothetical protein